MQFRDDDDDAFKGFFLSQSQFHNDAYNYRSLPFVYFFQIGYSTAEAK